MSWFEIAAARKNHTMFVSDQQKEPSEGEDAYFLSFSVIFSECSVSYNGACDEISNNFVEAIRKKEIQIDVSCPRDGVHNKTAIELRKSGAAFRVAMNHQEFSVFISMLQNSEDSKILRLSIPDLYRYRIGDGVLTRARVVLEGQGQGGVEPDDKVEIDLVGFGLLFDN